jgi:hypothetical protein
MSPAHELMALYVVVHERHTGMPIPGCIVIVRLGAFTMIAASRPLSVLRREALRDALPGVVDLLTRRRAVDIEIGYIDDCVALNWLEWKGGALRLTTRGNNVCKQLIDRLG